MRNQIISIARIIKKIANKFDNSTDIYLYKELYPNESVIDKRFYNIGAGNFNHPCWTNIDGDNEHFTKLNSASPTGIVHELFDHVPLNIEDDSAELIYTSHTIEHIDDASLSYLLKDVFRILKKGGIFRIVTPDIDKVYKAYKQNNRNFFFWSEWESMNTNLEKMGLSSPLKEASIEQLFLDDFAASVSELALGGAEQKISDSQLQKLFEDLSYEEALSYCTSRCSVAMQKQFPQRHCNWFNENKLTDMLHSAGFKTVFRSSYLQSVSAVLRNPKYFDGTLPQVSIYMEAVK